MKNIFLSLIVLIFVSCSSSEENCHKSLSLFPSSIDENYVNFLFKEDNGKDLSIIEYGEPGFQVGVDAIGVSRYFSVPYYSGIGDSKNHLITSFSPNTTYEAYIKLECSTNNYSELYGPVLFTTLAFGEGCTRPDSLSVIEKTSTTILIDWEGYNKEYWLVEIYFNDVNGYVEYIYYDVSEKPFLIEDLTPETTYNITVRTNYCEGLLESSMPSNEINVVTNN